MRYAIVLTLIIFFNAVVLGQNAKYPTVDALANMEIPAFDIVDFFRRISWIDTVFPSPASPPNYQIGDSLTLSLPTGGQPRRAFMPAELRGMTDNVLIWVEESVTYPRAKAQALAVRVDVDIVQALQRLFDYSEPPGVDADARLYVALVHKKDFNSAGSFTRKDTLPRSLISQSNQREMIVINLALEDGSFTDDGLVAQTIAHEFQHILTFHRDPNEEIWLDEALSGYAEHATAAHDYIFWQRQALLDAPNTGLTNFVSGDNRTPKYGAGELFSIFLAERFGSQVIEGLHADSADGWRSVDNVLRQSYGVSANEIFADWVLANYFLDADRGYGYRTIETNFNPPQPAAILRSFPARHSGSLPQFSVEYLTLDVHGADALNLQLSQTPAARLIEAAPVEGDQFYYALTSESSDSKLTRAIDLRQSRQAWLEFSVWFDLVEDIEYAYVVASTDRGETWHILPGEHTQTESPKPRFYLNGFTGSSDGWLRERINLADYFGRRIWLRFEVISSDLTTYKGMAIDDLRIDAIDYHDGFETHDDAWIAEGWIRTDNRLPNNLWLQVVQETDSGLNVTRELMSGPGELTVDLLPGANSALIAISPVVPQTALHSEYALEVNLLDAAGNVIVVERNCRVTTTAGLNFRDAPSGNKIGLLPQGTSAWSLASRDGWFNIEYNGQLGWISGDYVTTEGDCA